jgi:uncharacterized UPF0146 family protein
MDIEEKLDRALARLQEVGQGRQFNVGTKVMYRGRFGVVTDLNQGSEDAAGSTVDIRLDDGTVVDSVKVDSALLQYHRA